MIRAYDDYRKGVSITITEYSVTSVGESEAMGGIRINLEDLDKLISEMREEKEILALEQ